MTRGSSGNNNPNPNSNFIHHSIGKSQIESVKNRTQQQQSRPNMDPEYYFRPRVAALASAQMEYAG